MVFWAISAARTVIKGAEPGRESLARVDVENTFVRSVLKRVAQT